MQPFSKDDWASIYKEFNEEFAAKLKANNENEEEQKRWREKKQKEAEFQELQRQRYEALNVEANEQLERNIQCRNKYKNNQGKLQLPENLQDLPENQIYFYHGHGGTVCDDLGYPIIKQVPENCIYITQTVCGIVNTLKEEIVKAFLNPAYTDIWKDPVKHIGEIQRILGLGKQNANEGIHIHLPGCSYVESSYQPFGYHESKKENEEQYHKILFSGIMDLETAHTVSEESPYIQGVKLEHVDFVDYEKVKNSFEYSFFPRVEETDALVRNRNITNTFLLNPTKEGKVDINVVISQSGKISNTVLVSEILENLPGIHFNFLCRSFSKENTKCGKIPKKALTLRRRHSAVVQNSVYNTFQKLVSMGTMFPEIAKGVANDRSIRNYVESISNKLLKENDFAQLYDLYDSIRYEDGLNETKEYFRSVFLEPYLMKFFQLYTKLESSTNKNERNDVKDEIAHHIRILKMNPQRGYDSKRYGFENTLLANIAWFASLSEDDELFDYVCSKGNIDLSSGFQYNSNAIKKRWVDRCASVYDEALRNYIPSNNESNNGRFQSNEKEGDRRKKRKTLKKKRT